MITTENDILNQAIEAFRKETNLNIEIGEKDVVRNGRRFDVVLHINFYGRTIDYYAEIKVAAITAGQLTHFMFWITNLPGHTPVPKLIVARYVTPQMAKALKNLGIQFIDTAGNAYINDPPVFIFIDGKKPQQYIKPRLEQGMLDRAGIHVILALLCKPDLCDANYRKIANQAQVALGTVAGVMKELLALGYVVETIDNKRKLFNKEELLALWMRAYAEKFRPKNLIGNFAGLKPDFWQQAELDRFDAQWGGEVAAYRLTRYLKPEIVTIYTRRPIHDLTLGLKLRQDKNGNVELRERFWNFENPELDKTTVPPLLVYADLMATGDTRNIETAKQIYDDYLKRYIEQN